MTDPLDPLRYSLTHGRAVARGDRFGIWLDPTGAREILEHFAQLEARLAQAVIERDTARALVAALTSQPEQEP